MRVRGGGQVSELQAASRRPAQERAVRSLLSGKHQAVSGTATATDPPYVQYVHTIVIVRTMWFVFTCLVLSEGMTIFHFEISKSRVFIYAGDRFATRDNLPFALRIILVLSC